MTEIEQLRKELNELRERVVVLEAKKAPAYMPYHIPPYAPARDLFAPPFVITCGGNT